MMPKNLNQWVQFGFAVFVAGVAISAILRRVPQLAALTESI